jgi:hypothetical protein
LEVPIGLESAELRPMLPDAAVGLYVLAGIANEFNVKVECQWCLVQRDELDS